MKKLMLTICTCLLAFYVIGQSQHPQTPTTKAEYDFMLEGDLDLGRQQQYEAIHSYKDYISEYTFTSLDVMRTVQNRYVGTVITIQDKTGAQEVVCIPYLNRGLMNLHREQLKRILKNKKLAKAYHEFIARRTAFSSATEHNALNIITLYSFNYSFATGDGPAKTTQFQGAFNIQSPQAELFYRASKWVEYHLHGDEKLSLDKPKGQIKGRCSQKVNMNFSGIEVPMILYYTLEVVIHHEEVAYQIYHISFESIPDQGYPSKVIQMDKWMEHQSLSTSSHIRTKYKMKTITEVGEIVGYLTAYLQKEVTFNQ